jgi:hypothetical protein
MSLNSISGATKVPHGRKVKADKTVGPIMKGETYELLEINNVSNRYLVDVGGVQLSYPMEYFFYVG